MSWATSEFTVARVALEICRSSLSLSPNNPMSGHLNRMCDNPPRYKARWNKGTSRTMGSTNTYFETMARAISSSFLSKLAMNSYSGATSSFHHSKLRTERVIVPAETVAPPVPLFSRCADHVSRLGSEPVWPELVPDHALYLWRIVSMALRKFSGHNTSSDRVQEQNGIGEAV